MVRQTITPLDWRTKLVNPDGTPTPQFIRLWQQISGNDQNSENGKAAKGLIEDSGLTMLSERILGRKDPANGAIQELSISEALDLVGSPSQGDILYRGASWWVKLTPGTSGHFLQTQGLGANPQWAAASGGSGTFRGALAYLAVNDATSTTWPKFFTHDAVDFDTDGFVSVVGNTRLTVPSGVSYVQVSAGAVLTTTASAQGYFVGINKNGTSFPGQPQININGSNTGFTNKELVITSGAISVVENDYFELRVNVFPATYNAGFEASSYISIHVLG